MSHPEFTPEAVRAALIAAGHPEYATGERSGFRVGDNRDSLWGAAEILVGHQRAFVPGEDFPPWGEAAKAQQQQALRSYQDALIRAGYATATEERKVIVKEVCR